MNNSVHFITRPNLKVFFFLKIMVDREADADLLVLIKILVAFSKLQQVF